MRIRTWIACALVASMGAPAFSQQLSDTARLGAGYTRAGSEIKLGINLDDASGSIYFLQVSFDDFATLPILIGPLPIGADGMAWIGGHLDESLFPADTEMSYRALFKEGAWVKKTNVANVVLNGPGCESLDPNVGVGGVPLLKGEVVTEQWGGIGMHVSCQSFDPMSGPNTCIVLDSGNTTETDEMTPGYGPGNDTALGNLLIVAENLVDADNDGYVDEPNDAFDGGIISMTFDEAKTICSGTFTDIDDGGVAKMRFYADAAGTQLITAVTIPNAGDNSVQTLFVHVDGVKRLDLKGGGSFGVGAVSWCPTCIDFDQTTMGIPLNLQAGEEVTDQFAGLGLNISADNANPTGPDKAIIFDTANPTGGDTDLATPGYHPTNTVALDKVLIIAENDVDANNDGLVDDPDDEAYGGHLYFDFDFDVKILDVTVIDVDGQENSYIECRDASNNVLSTTPLAILGDNSVQTVNVDTQGVRQCRVVMGGSGAVAKLCFCPDDT